MVQLDGEGIGRFVVRLVEGLLLNDSDVVVHVATTEQNYADLQSLLAEYVTFFPHRLFLLSFPNVEWLNRNMDVDLCAFLL